MAFARNLTTSVLMSAVTILIVGLLYPVAMTGLAQVLFPWEANGSLVERQGRPLGSVLVGQPFSSPGYFRSRPSAAGSGYDAASSGGSNLGPTNATLIDRVRKDAAAWQSTNPGVPVPVDLVTTSASGLDPHVSPASASFQVPRVARERRVSEAQVRDLVAECTRGRWWGFVGESVVNVLLLNLALDERHPMPGQSSTKR